MLMPRWMMLMVLSSWYVPPLAEADQPSDGPPLLTTSLAGGRVTVQLGGQLRDRFEYTGGRDFASGGEDEFVSQRARLTVSVSLLQRLDFLVQIQDVRIWGEEKDTLGDYAADGLDLHQGWARIWLARHVFMQAGRMEINLDEQRLVGAVNWAQQARSFDAVLFGFEPKWLQARMFYSKLAEQDAAASGAATDKDLVVAWVRLTHWSFFVPSILYVLDTDYDSERVRHTFGLFAKGAHRGLAYSAEFYGQLGRQHSTDTRAFMGAVKVGYTFDVAVKPGIWVWGDFLSGDSNLSDDTTRSFDTLFATNHKFYGNMDLFLNIPKHTGGRGLMDIGARLHLQPFDGFTLRVDYHFFRLMSDDDNGQRMLGHEVDAVLGYSWLRYVRFQAGYGVFVPDDAMTQLRGSDNVEHWVFLQTDVAF